MIRLGFRPILAGILAAGVWVQCSPRVDILALFEEATSPNTRIAARARNRLNQLVLERRVDLFRAVLEKGEDEERGLALIYLGRVGTPEAVELLAEHLDPGDRFPVNRDPVTTARLATDVDSRFLIARILNLLGPPEGAVERVLPALQSSDPEEKEMGILILGALGDPTAVPHLVPLAGDPDPLIERRAVEAIGRLGNPVAIPVLLERATRADSSSRRLALSMLERFRDPAIPERLLEVYPRTEDPNLRFAMISVLGRYADPRVVPVLIDALDSQDPNLRRMAESRLCDLTHRPPGLSRDDWRRWWEENREGYRFPP